MSARKPVPWFWWIRLGVTIAAVSLFDASNAGPRGWLHLLALLGTGMAAAATADLARWSYRKAQQEARQ